MQLKVRIHCQTFLVNNPDEYFRYECSANFYRQTNRTIIKKFSVNDGKYLRCPAKLFVRVIHQKCTAMYTPLNGGKNWGVPDSSLKDHLWYLSSSS